MHTCEEAQVFVHDLNQFVTVQPLEETPALLSLGTLCEDHGYSNEWVSGQKLRLTPNGKTIIWKTNNFVPIYVPRLSVNSGSSSSSITAPEDSSSPVLERSEGLAPGDWTRPTPKTKNQNKNRDDKNSVGLLEDILDWLTEFKENLVEELPAFAHSSPGTDFGTSCKSGDKITEAQYWNSFSERSTLRRKLEDQNDKGSLQKTHWRSSTSSRKVWWRITADHKLLNEGFVNPETITRYAVVEQDLATQWNQSYPRINKILTWDEEMLVKVLEPSHRPNVENTDNSMEFGKACEDLSWNHRTSTLHHSKTKGIAERAVRRVKEGTSAVFLISSIATVRTGWKVGGLGQEDATWKTIWRTIQRANNILWSNGWISSHFTERSGQEFINLARKYYQESFLGYEPIAGGIWKGDIFDSRSGRIE